MKHILLTYVLAACLVIMGCTHEMYNLDGIDNIGADTGYDDSDAQRRIKVAAVTMNCSKEKSVNIPAIEAMITKIKSEHDDVELIVFGETTLGHYYIKNSPVNYQRSLAEEIPGATSLQISQLAAAKKVAVVFGMGELKDGRMYNSSCFVDAQGGVTVVARKNILIDKDKKSGYSPGESGNTIDFDGITLGFIICSDNTSASLIKKLVKNGADVVVHIAAGGGEEQQKAYARAVDAWVVQANRYGNEDGMQYEGFCGISAPTGITKAGSSGRQGYVFRDMGVYE